MPNAVVVSLLLFATLALTCATASSTQQRETAPPKISSAAAARALAYLREHATTLAVQPADLDDVIVTSETTSELTGVTHVYLRQRYKGIDISRAEITVNVARDGAVINQVGEFVANLARAVNKPSRSMDAAAAVVAAAKHLGITLTESERASIPARRVYHPIAAGELRLAWQVEIKTRDEQHWWVATLDAVSGALLEKTDRVVSLKEEVA